MTLSTLLENMDYKCLQGTTDTNIHDIVYDSRKAGPGDLFVCISGTRTDAHSFLPEVIQKGVKAVVVERDVEVPKDVTVIRVARAREALSMVGLLDAAEENPYDLDLSERKMVAIASVVAMDTQVLILDEPTIAQDARGRAVIGLSLIHI